MRIIKFKKHSYKKKFKKEAFDLMKNVLSNFLVEKIEIYKTGSEKYPLHKIKMKPFVSCSVSDISKSRHTCNIKFKELKKKKSYFPVKVFFITSKKEDFTKRLLYCKKRKKCT